jgi:hypothetical protein
MQVAVVEHRSPRWPRRNLRGSPAVLAAAARRRLDVDFLDRVLADVT